jgi:hypothetical protein
MTVKLTKFAPEKCCYCGRTVRRVQEVQCCVAQATRSSFDQYAEARRALEGLTQPTP